jgi:hypothetical protein
LGILFARRLREVNRRWRRSFLHNNLLRLRSSLTDHDWLRRRLRAVIVFSLSLVSLELIRLFATFGDALLDSDISFPNVPFRVPWSTRLAVAVPRRAFHLATVPLVNRGSCAVALRFAEGLSLDISLDDC